MKYVREDLKRDQHQIRLDQTILADQTMSALMDTVISEHRLLMMAMEESIVWTPRAITLVEVGMDRIMWNQRKC